MSISIKVPLPTPEGPQKTTGRGSSVFEVAELSETGVGSLTTAASLWLSSISSSSVDLSSSFTNSGYHSLKDPSNSPKVSVKSSFVKTRSKLSSPKPYSSSAFAFFSRLATSSSDSVPRFTNRDSRTRNLDSNSFPGGAMNTYRGSNELFFTLRTPCTSMSKIQTLPELCTDATAETLVP